MCLFRRCPTVSATRVGALRDCTSARASDLARRGRRGRAHVKAGLPPLLHRFARRRRRTQRLPCTCAADRGSASLAAARLAPIATADLGASVAAAARPVRHLVLDLVRHHQEGGVHKRARLRTRLEKGNVLRLGEALALGRLDLTVVVGALGNVGLVAHQQLVDVLARVLVDLGEPPDDVVERRAVGHIVHDDDAVRAAVVSAADRAEALLARRVPNLQLDGFSI